MTRKLYSAAQEKEKMPNFIHQTTVCLTCTHSAFKVQMGRGVLILLSTACLPFCPFPPADHPVGFSQQTEDCREPPQNSVSTGFKGKAFVLQYEELHTHFSLGGYIGGFGCWRYRKDFSPDNSHLRLFPRKYGHSDGGMLDGYVCFLPAGLPAAYYPMRLWVQCALLLPSACSHPAAAFGEAFSHA